MAYLDIVVRWWCKTNEEWSRQVPGSGGKNYVVRYGRVYDPNRNYEAGFTCDCPSYARNNGPAKGPEGDRECKHIQAVKGEWCGWNEEYDEGKVERVGIYIEKHYCPKCGGPATTYRMGV